MTRHEDLDDVIDRVASAMTIVPSDPALPARIAARLDQSPRGFAWWPRLAFGAIALAAVALLAVNTDVRSGRSLDRPIAAAPAVEAAVTTPAIESTFAARAGAPVIARAPRRARVIGVPAAQLAQIDALSTPAMLDIDDLTTTPLTMTSVDLAPLDLANLALGGSNGRDEPEEKQ
jgi:hypothetical protein